MKTKGLKRITTCILIVIMLIAMQAPAFAQSATVNVEFVVKNQQGPYKNVKIVFGNNTKTTGSNGKANFKLKNIPVTTMINAHLIDYHVPTGYQCDINLALGAHEDVQVNSTVPYQANISVMYTEYTKTIVIEFFVGHNTSYGYSNVEFEHKLISQPKQKQQNNPIQPPAPGNGLNPSPQQGYDPDVHDEPGFNEPHEDMRPDNDYNQEPFMPRIMPRNVWIIIIAGILLLVTIIILIIGLGRRKKVTKH